MFQRVQPDLTYMESVIGVPSPSLLYSLLVSTSCMSHLTFYPTDDVMVTRVHQMDNRRRNFYLMR